MPCDTVTVTTTGGGTGGLTVGSVTFASSEVEVGTTAIAYFTVSNTTSGSLSETIPVSVNGSEVAAIDTQVSAGSSKQYEVEFTVPDSDSVTVTVGSMSNSVPVSGGSGNTGESDDIIGKATTFAKENPLVVGAGVLGLGVVLSNRDSNTVIRRGR